MNANKAPYLIQRQCAAEDDWMPVTFCVSMTYAETVAAIGMQHGLAGFYRVLELQSGVVKRLAPTLTANAV